MQRLHMDDLTGFILSQSKDWTVLSLPAIAEQEAEIALPYGRVYRRRPGAVLQPEREPLHVLQELRAFVGADVFSAQYQQAPVPPAGAMIKRHWVQRYTEPPEPLAGRVLQSWDTAAKGGPDNDWSVCTTWLRVGEYWNLLDVWRSRVNYPTLKEQVKAHAFAWNADFVLIEEAGTAIGLLQELRGEVPGLIGIDLPLKNYSSFD
jgi:hypothetical protein